MKKLVGIVLLILPMLAQASVGVSLDEVDVDVSDKASLMRGAQYFATYCQSCHSIKHMRYSRIADDLAIPEKQVEQELIPGGGFLYSSMTTAMSAKDAEQWFAGAKAPDLSLIARSRGPDWLYTYLRGFYLDAARPFGVNNVVFPDVAMPNVLWEMQGQQKAVFKKEGKTEVLDRLMLVEGGQMTPQEFDAAITDLVNFLVYAGEPAQLQRTSLGKYVILFLIVFLVLAYRLKKEFWKDVH
jgi:ubiquinol-cytochrome c reductase cytochrome c1 subunit